MYFIFRTRIPGTQSTPLPPASRGQGLRAIQPAVLSAPTTTAQQAVADVAVPKKTKKNQNFECVITVV